MPGITPSNPTTLLVDLQVDAVALVAEGANTRAHILLTKNRRETKDMTFEELCKSLQPDAVAIINAQIEAVKSASIADLEAQLAQQKAAAAAAEELAKSAKKTDEEILKSLPKEAQLIIEELQKSNRAFIEASETMIAKERFEKVKAIPAPEEELKAVLKSASPAVFAILEKAAATIEAGLGKSAGRDASGNFEDTDTVSYATLEAKANAIAKASNISFEKAFTQACVENPEVYNKYLKGVK